MKSHKFNLKVRGEYLPLVLASCSHIGSLAFAEKHWKSWRDEVLKNPDNRIIMLGDTTENATKTSPGSSIWEQRVSPKDQVEFAIDLIEPMKDRILIWHESNHSYRTRKDAGAHTPEELMSRHFGIPWGGWQSLSSYVVRKGKRSQSYVGHCMHGTGGGTSMQAALSSLGKQAMLSEADFYARGHHHRPVAARMTRFQYRDQSRPDGRNAVLAATGGFLDYHDSYAEAAGYIPNSYGCITLKLHVKHKYISFEG